MRIVRHQFHIEPQNPFAADQLGRKAFADELTALFKNISHEIVLNLYAEWGEGKTCFIKMWQADLLRQGIKSIYIDAFKNDFMEEPFIAVTKSIYSEIMKNFSEHKDLIEENESFKEKAIAFCKKSFVFSAGLATRVATQGVITCEDYPVVGDELGKHSGDAVSNYLRSKFDNNLEQNAYTQFSKQLESLGTGVKEAQKFPLLIIVDELDRCRPPFAVELLEKVKHLFSVKNVNFVLVTNKKQLNNSIRAVYGADIDADLYLQRFITVSTALPKGEKDHGEYPERYYSEFCSQVIKDYDIKDGHDDQYSKSLPELLSYYAAHFNLSLRQIETAARLLMLHYITSNFFPMPLAVFIAVLGAIDSETTGKIARKQLGLQNLKELYDISALFEERRLREPEAPSALKRLSPLLVMGFGTQEEFNALPEEFKKRYDRCWEDFAERRVAADIAQRMMRY